MAKSLTLPALYDEVLSFSTKNLKELGYLNLSQIKNGIINWSRKGEISATISITVNTITLSPYIELSYTYQEKSINYKVQLVQAPSNLGKGLIWFFLCPQTGKRCRKLYKVGSKFLHRNAFTGCMYYCQTQSHNTRLLRNWYKQAFCSGKVYELIGSKHFKTHYANKPTKRYLKLLKKIDEGNLFNIKKIDKVKSICFK